MHTHRGTCHCGAVAFEATFEADSGSSCNCSICNKLGLVGHVVKPEAFKLLRGETQLSTYVWGNKTATRYFCSHCGVTCFMRGSDYVGVSMNALDDVDLAKVHIGYTDGAHDNWHAGSQPERWPRF